jgi:hypothetical protein
MFGVLLGLTFRVFILVPAALLVLVGLPSIGAASEAGAVWMIALDIGVIAAMQLGYAGGSVVVAKRVRECHQKPHRRGVSGAGRGIL